MSFGGFIKKLISGHPIEAIKELAPTAETPNEPPPKQGPDYFPPIPPIPPPPPPPPPDDRYLLITQVQSLKRQYIEMGQHSSNRPASDRYVLRNPVTGQAVPTADLRYARNHLAEIYESGAIREPRWAFLWYH